MLLGLVYLREFRGMIFFHILDFFMAIDCIEFSLSQHDQYI